MGTPVQFKLKSGTTSEWNLANPTLLQGEPGVDISKNILKIIIFHPPVVLVIYKTVCLQTPPASLCAID